MQVSGSYTAVGSILGVEPAQGIRRPSVRSGTNTGDTVSISEEALAAYRNSCQEGEAPQDAAILETGAKFRKALEDAWNGSGETSLSSRLLSAISSWKSAPQDLS